MAESPFASRPCPAGSGPQCSPSRRAHRLPLGGSAGDRGTPAARPAVLWAKDPDSPSCPGPAAPLHPRIPRSRRGICQPDAAGRGAPLACGPCPAASYACSCGRLRLHSPHGRRGPGLRTPCLSRASRLAPLPRCSSVSTPLSEAPSTPPGLPPWLPPG
ncbi:uncharacterized protein LOC115068094 [Nannospalax galili]|uniref:uncharacterized protein LOC115068094 n=1 Tax=Nannospalax galili TaxID=1026970 RepID=UPI00111BEE2C|nr:uncharacterized protein LOC115068094 [Nannospalax galili]